MKLKNDITIIRAGGEQLAVLPKGDNRIIRMNGTAARIMECLKEETDIESIVAALKAEYSGSDEDIRRGVEKIIAGLRAAGIIQGN